MNCKPGDLAYVVRALHEDHIGKVVEVLNDSMTFPQAGFCWLVRARDPIGAECPKTGRKLGFFNEVFCPDDWLRPISGVPIENDTPVSVNLPEAFKLALGIEMRVWA